MHTLKGMSAAMGYGASAELAHALEHLLERLRTGGLSLDAPAADLLLEGVDALEDLLERESRGAAAADGALLERLRGEDAASPTPPPPARTPAEPAAPTPRADGRLLHIEARLAADARLPAARAVMLLRRAAELGTVRRVEPPEPRIREGDFSGALTLQLETGLAPAVVAERLEAVGEVAGVRVRRPRARRAGRGGPHRAGAAGAPGRAAEPDGRAGDRARPPAAASPERLADPELSAAVDRGGAPGGRAAGRRRSEMRLAPVGEVFDRFPAWCATLARAWRRRSSSRRRGARRSWTARSLNELGDLLVHLLRNAMDHGIETPAARRAAGKPETGLVRLRGAARALGGGGAGGGRRARDRSRARAGAGARARGRPRRQEARPLGDRRSSSCSPAGLLHRRGG